MTVRVGKFEKVSVGQFLKDSKIEDSVIGGKLYNEIKIPSRATKGSAGYDVCTPIEINMKPGETFLVPTGLKCKVDNGWVLMAFPKSGLGFKYKVRLCNTVGIIDEDYYDNESNEGHIMIKLSNEGDKDIHLGAGDKFCQMLFMQYGITYDDNAEGLRTGGFGSTGK